jgi:hypothetical protein
MMSEWAFGSKFLGVLERSVWPPLLSPVDASGAEWTHDGLENLKEVFVIIIIVFAIFSFFLSLVSTGLFLFII